jgi:Putative beta barrel porin-7 (BBP7)
VSAGVVSVETQTDLYGFDANYRHNLCCDCNYRLDFVGGYRFLALKDALDIRENLTTTDPAGAVPPGTRLLAEDEFRTENYFNGGQFGVAGEVRYDKFFVDGRALVALGVTHQVTDIGGSTAIIPPPPAAATAAVGGLLAQMTNIGRRTHDEFAVVPELSVRVGYQVSPCLRLTAGYSLLYWNNVVRPGDLIDPGVNPTQLPPGTLAGPNRPAFTSHTSDVFLHGFSVGAEFRF